jgi:hypothetical protein
MSVAEKTGSSLTLTGEVLRRSYPPLVFGYPYIYPDVSMESAGGIFIIGAGDSVTKVDDIAGYLHEKLPDQSHDEYLGQYVQGTYEALLSGQPLDLKKKLSSLENTRKRVSYVAACHGISAVPDIIAVNHIIDKRIVGEVLTATRDGLPDELKIRSVATLDESEEIRLAYLLSARKTRQVLGWQIGKHITGISACLVFDPEEDINLRPRFGSQLLAIWKYREFVDSGDLQRFISEPDLPLIPAYRHGVHLLAEVMDSLSRAA